MTARVRVPVGGGRWVRWGASAALRAAATSQEPSSTLVAAGLRSSTGLRIVLTVEDRRGEVLGAVVLHRLGTAQWDALPLVVDDRGTGIIARLIDRSPATAVLGIGPHVAPLVEHMGRARSIGRSPFFGSADLNGAPPTDLDPRTRAAGAADVPALARLLATSYRLSRPPDLASWTRSLRQTTAEGLAVVAEVDGEVVGGVLCTVSDHWAFGTDTAVREDHRGQGLSWAMADRMFALVVANGLMMCGAKVDENPMDVDRHYADHGALSGELWGVALDPHVRWPSTSWRRHQTRRIRRWAADPRTAAAARVRRPR